MRSSIPNTAVMGKHKPDLVARFNNKLAISMVRGGIEMHIGELGRSYRSAGIFWKGAMGTNQAYCSNAEDKVGLFPVFHSRSHPSKKVELVYGALLATCLGLWGCLSRIEPALTGVAQWVGRRPANPKVAGLVPGQGTYLHGGPGSQLGVRKRRPTDVLFLSSFSRPSPLSKSK